MRVCTLHIVHIHKQNRGRIICASTNTYRGGRGTEAGEGELHKASMFIHAGNGVEIVYPRVET